MFFCQQFTNKWSQLILAAGWLQSDLVSFLNWVCVNSDAKGHIYFHHFLKGNSCEDAPHISRNWKLIKHIIPDLMNIKFLSQSSGPGQVVPHLSCLSPNRLETWRLNSEVRFESASAGFSRQISVNGQATLGKIRWGFRCWFLWGGGGRWHQSLWIQRSI